MKHIKGITYINVINHFTSSFIKSNGILQFDEFCSVLMDYIGILGEKM